MGIIEILLLVASGLAALLGRLYKSQVKKNAKLEIEKESFEEAVKTAIKQQDVLKLSEEEEQATIREVTEDLKKKIEEAKKDEEPTDIDTLVNMFNGVRDKRK